MKEALISRYQKGWITPEQLHRYAALGAITPSDLAAILGDTADEGAALGTTSR